MLKVDNFPHSKKNLLFRIKFGVFIPFRVYPWCRGLPRAKSYRPISREIIIEEFQRVWSQSTNVTDGQTDRRATYHDNTAIRYLSRGKNQFTIFIMQLSSSEFPVATLRCTFVSQTFVSSANISARVTVSRTGDNVWDMSCRGVTRPPFKRRQPFLLSSPILSFPSPRLPSPP